MQSVQGGQIIDVVKSLDLACESGIHRYVGTVINVQCYRNDKKG